MNKKEAEKMIKEVLEYLYKVKIYDQYDERVKLYDNVMFFSNNACYSIDDSGVIKKEDNFKIEDYFSCFDEKVRINISMDSILCEYMYYGDAPGSDEVKKNIYGIVNKYNLDIDFGSNWYMILFKIGDYSIKY